MHDAFDCTRALNSVAADLVKQLREKKVGVVAHFYMDPEVREN